jgi:hypothetical protein
MNEEKSRIDAKIKRDALLRHHREDLWTDLSEMVDEVCKKLNTHFAADLTLKTNDHNSLIHVAAATIRFEGQPLTREIDIRFNRGENKIIAKLVHTNSIVATYIPKVNPVDDKLGFFLSGNFYSPLAVAETLLAEKLLELDLNS